jgi:hypothetical protein
LYDDYARYIYTGLNGLYGHPNKIGWKILMIGCQMALVKFLLEFYEGVEIVLLCGKNKSVK